ncbi:hypothetical protein F5X97DRAFT_303584 [Nemania serpens]|nr:hypothetical protein F5X97DRAFT_303584 [Nemania serpens]
MGYKALTFAYNAVAYVEYLWYVGLASGSVLLFATALPVLKSVVNLFIESFTSQLSTVDGLGTTSPSEIQDTLETTEADADAAIGEEAAVNVGEVVVADIAVSTLGFIGVDFPVAAVCAILAPANEIVEL